MEIVDIKVDPPCFKIYIKGLLHLSLRADKIISFHSYIGDGLIYYIEYQTKETTITTEYWVRDLWEAILRKIDQSGIF